MPRKRTPSNGPGAYDVSVQDGVWTVAEAKSRLSEVLRRASEIGPQQIGKQRPHVVVPIEQWRAHAEPGLELGAWLVENAPRDCEIELPSRDDGDREVPFADLEFDE
jgi:hypothetical protein